MSDASSQEPEEKTQKTGILLVAYGSASQPGALSLRGVTAQARELFPGLPLRWAFTSPRMRNRLAQNGKKTDSVYKALCRMTFEGYTHVAVQSLHIIAGFEYEHLLQEVEQARREGGPRAISVGLPLLGDASEVELAAKALVAHLPRERAPEDAVVCVGHGSGLALRPLPESALEQGGLECSAPDGYEALARAVGNLDANVFIGALAGEPGVETAIERLRARHTRRVWLIPLLSVLGKHAEEDLAGQGSRSWRSRLEQAGFICKPVLCGAVEYDGLLYIWMRHLERAVRELQE